MMMMMMMNAFSPPSFIPRGRSNKTSYTSRGCQNSKCPKGGDCACGPYCACVKGSRECNSGNVSSSKTKEKDKSEKEKNQSGASVVKSSK